MAAGELHSAVAAAVLRFVAENEIASIVVFGFCGMDQFGVLDPIKEIFPKYNVKRPERF